jgi:hypothetical protein
MPKIDLVPVMKKAPGRCAICNTTPMENGKPKPAIDANVDVDWGNNLYVCDECVRVMAELMGFKDPKDVAELQGKLTDLEARHSRLRRRFKKQESRLERILEGRKAERIQKKQRKQRKKARAA